jgi:type I restriction enzyme, S subunit
MMNKAMDAPANEDVGLRCANPTYAAFEFIETVYGELPSNLKEAKLSTICEKNGVQTGPFGSQLHKEDYVIKGTPIITVEHLGENRIVHENLPRVSDEDKTRLSKYQLKTGDIVFSRVGSVDRRALVQTKENGWLFSGRCLRVKPIQEIVNSRWLSYFFGLPAFKNYIRGIAVGATMPSLNTKILSDIPIYFPPLNIQKSAAKILIDLDDRIELLRETNATLEAIAQALFKSWFVDFDPVRAKQACREPEVAVQGCTSAAEGRMPEAALDSATAALFPDSFEESELGLVPSGWRASTLDEISTVGIGKTPPRKEQHWFSENPNDVRWVSIRDMGISGAYISTTNEFLTAESIDRFNVRVVPDNTVMLSFKMTIGRVAISDGEMTTNEAIAHFKLDGQVLLSTEFIYLHLKQFDYSTLSSTSSIADAVNSKTVKSIPILIPAPEILVVFQDQISVIFQKIKIIEQQIKTLTTLRDTLLPRLISGQLRLPEAKTLLEETTAC